MENNNKLKQIEIDNKNSNIMFFMALLTLFGVYIVLVIMNLLDNRIEPFGLAFLSFAYSLPVGLFIVLILYYYETNYYNSGNKNWFFIETIGLAILIYFILKNDTNIQNIFKEYSAHLMIFLITQTIKYFVYQKYCKTIPNKGDTNGK